MNIVYVITGLSVGGAESQVCNLASEFSRAGDNVLIVSLSGIQLMEPSDKNVTVISLMMGKNIYSFLICYIKAIKIINNFNADVVHSHMFHANIFTRLLKLTLKMRKLICSAHSSDEGGKLRMLAYRLTDHLCDITTNVSDFATNSFIKKRATLKERIKTIPNGVDTNIFKFLPPARKKIRDDLEINPEEFLILAVGRLVPAKDYPTLLNSIKILIDSCCNVRLAIAGDGELKNDLIEMSKDLEIFDKVIFLGSRSDIPSLMSAADVFVLSSEWEGFGLVVAEAMACERLVVTTDCGGPADIVIQKDFLVNSKDPNKLASALHRAINLDPKESRAISEKSRNHIISNYSIKSAVKNWYQLYK